MMGATPAAGFQDETLIWVDAFDRVLGYRSKEECHKGLGLLHRAFSIFLFDGQGNVLLQQRSAQKKLWPLYWSNACCSHPRCGETIEQAAHRRLKEELAVQTPLDVLFKFTYQARFENIGSEHELCSVLVGKVDSLPCFNADEVASLRFVSPQSLDKALQDPQGSYTPWLKLEWLHLRGSAWCQRIGSVLARS